MDSLLVDSFVRLLTEISPPAVVRSAEKEGDTAAIWDAIQSSGFLNALLPEEKGGAGLSLAEVLPLVVACGEYLLPIPFAETMVARALIAEARIEVPVEGPILLWPQSPQGQLRSQVAPLFCHRSFALAQQSDRLMLLALEDDTRDGFGLVPARVRAGAEPLVEFAARGVDLTSLAAASTAALMVGAMNKVLEISIDYANERQQFGRPLAKFQVIQHQLAVMAEKLASANVAARMGFAGNAGDIDHWRAAVAKCVANEAAGPNCAGAHAILGAVGITEEHDLQLYTRRIKRWQLSFGSDSYWAREIAMPRLSSNDGTSIDFIRQRLASSVPVR